MKFLTILMIVFFDWAAWVGADYYVEFQGQPMVTNVRGRTSPTIYLYECRGVPAGIPAYAADESECNRVESKEDKIYIYANHNFYSAFRSNLQRHRIHFYDRGYLPLTVWNIGYSSDNTDLPNFAPPSPTEDIVYFRDRIIEQLGSDDTFIQPYIVTDLAQYFAWSNIIALSENSRFANSLFHRFDNFLTSITQRCGEMMQETNSPRANALKEKINHAMGMALQKMVDPCSVLRGNFHVYASTYCVTYCNFLNTVGNYFRTCASSCGSLQGGHCDGPVCVCSRLLYHPFAGCDSDRIASPMKLCHNSVRAKLNF